MSRVLLIDIGNSSTKICWAEGGILGEQMVIPAGEEIERKSEIFGASDHSGCTRGAPKEHPCCSQKNRIMISSVSSRLKDMMPMFEEEETYILRATDELPFFINYKTKETLGADRVAAIAGAIALYGRRNMLVVDMGTAITLDYYDGESNTFIGGNISPGVRLRAKSLNDYTSKLPLVDVGSDYKCEKVRLGRETKEAILEGIMQGIRLEVEGYRREIEEKVGKEILLVLTGGDSKYFHSSTKNCNFAPENLVLRGLAYIDSWLSNKA
ncbi:MAG: type III pantothenate kinase [Bacteroidia bacterium]|nr:type III pantothenate kinase [Bacteroidia bacterium]